MPKHTRPYLDEIMREHLRSQAQLLRENDYTNKRIAEILHVSTHLIATVLGPLAAERRAAILSVNARQTRAARPPLSDEDRQFRKRLAIRRKASRLKQDCSDNAGLCARLSALMAYEPQGTSNETTIHMTSDIVSAVRSDNGRCVVRMVDGQVDIRPLDSDDYQWVDEPEEEWPVVPDDRWFARYAGWWRREQQLRQEDELKGYSERFLRISHARPRPPLTGSHAIE